MHVKCLQIDGHNQIGIECFAERWKIDPSIFIDPAGNLLLIDHPRLADILFEQPPDNRRQFAC